MTYEEAKARGAAIEAEVAACSARIRAAEAPYPKGPMNLPSDALRASPEWRAARADFARAFAALRAFNTGFLRLYGAEYRAERRARREARNV